MKRKNNLYDNILNMQHIKDVILEVSRNTKNKHKVEKYHDFYTVNIYRIYITLKNRRYKPGKYNIFMIREPKIRIVMSQSIFDKVINHLVSHYILNLSLENHLIDTNVATRIDKGTHYGMKKVKLFLNKLKSNGNVYALKFDIKKYFYSINHSILKEKLKKKIKDKESLKIIFDIIDSTNEDYVNKEIQKLKAKALINCNDKQKNEIESIPFYKKGYGLPIGNYSSQILAIFYLSDLDHYIKEKLGCKYYVRYQDDGILLSNDKNYLKVCLKEITNKLKEFDLELNSKTMIINCKSGFNFLGFNYKIDNNKIIMRVVKQTKKKFKRKIKLYKNNKLDNSDQVLMSYKGHLKYGDTKGLVIKLDRLITNHSIGL